MAKIKFTKNELKNQRDALKRFQRFLPTLQLKKQQLQLEVRQLRDQMADLEAQLAAQQDGWATALPLLSGNDRAAGDDFLTVKSWKVGRRNVAGIDVPVFESLEFAEPDYDLFLTPPWYDDIAAMLRQQLELTLRKQILGEMLELIEQELRVVTQRVNLFEKVKIPESQENIRKINIYIGDQMTNSVGRSKIAKGKCAQRDAETLV
ncbi:MAG: V-type ATP synthase subunit D [Victivallales bacterium]|nr:V-type ATP synthase subunit D [Victivallales bacterium]